MKAPVAGLLVRAYPATWRKRYGVEYAALLEDVAATPRTIADVLAAAVGARMRAFAGGVLSTSGGASMTFDLGGWHARTFAWLAILVALPTTILLTVNALAYNVGIPGLAGAIEPIENPLLNNKIVGLAFMGAPVLAFIIAVLPVMRFSVRRDEGELTVSLAIRSRALTVVAVVLSLLLIAFLAMHSVAEFLFGT